MDYWLTTGREELYRSVEKTSTLNEGVAKNVILFVGRGMGVSTVTASRIYKAQQVNGNFDTPESEYLTFERMDHMGHSRVSQLKPMYENIILMSCSFCHRLTI